MPQSPTTLDDLQTTLHAIVAGMVLLENETVILDDGRQQEAFESSLDGRGLIVVVHQPATSLPAGSNGGKVMLLSSISVSVSENTAVEAPEGRPTLFGCLCAIVSAVINASVGPGSIPWAIESVELEVFDQGMRTYFANFTKLVPIVV